MSTVLPHPVLWIRNNQNGEYFDFLRLNLHAPYFTDRRGVYIIWYASPAGAKVIRVGQGNIGERLLIHRSDPQIIRFADRGPLKVTWTLCPEDMLSGVEAYLFDYYKPLQGERAQGVVAIPVTPLI
jgi:hypothetical protein